MRTRPEWWQPHSLECTSPGEHRFWTALGQGAACTAQTSLPAEQRSGPVAPLKHALEARSRMKTTLLQSGCSRSSTQAGPAALPRSAGHCCLKSSPTLGMSAVATDASRWKGALQAGVPSQSSAHCLLENSPITSDAATFNKAGSLNLSTAPGRPWLCAGIPRAHAQD